MGTCAVKQSILTCQLVVDYCVCMCACFLVFLVKHNMLKQTPFIDAADIC